MILDFVTKKMWVGIRVCMWCVCVQVHVRVSSCIGLVTCCSVSDPLVRSEPGNRRREPDLDWCSLLTRYAGYSKTGSWDDL